MKDKGGIWILLDRGYKQNKEVKRKRLVKNLNNDSWHTPNCNLNIES